MPRFSVVVPVYNRARTVLPTLQSVQGQTLRDFECIVVDDGSADGEELRAVVKGLKDERFRYVRRENGGGSAARNTGIDQARGEFVAFLDSDDRWLPGKLRRDAEACAENRVVFSPMLVERGGRIVGQRPRRGPRATEAIGDYLTRGEGFVPSSTVTVPVQLARSVRYDDRLCFGDDLDFAIRVGATCARLHFLSDPQSIMNDDETRDRLSRSRDWRTLVDWLNRPPSQMSDRARYAFWGSHVARIAAEDGHHLIALKFYFSALSRRAFTPSLAVKALMQIFMRRSLLRAAQRRWAKVRSLSEGRMAS